MLERKSIRVAVGGKEEARIAEEVANAAGLDLQIQPRPQFAEPVTVLLVGAGTLVLAKFIVDLVDRLRGGIVIDLRPAANTFVRREHSVPYGWALVLAVDGRSVAIETHDAPKDAAERLISEFIAGTLKNSAEIIKAATAAVGGAKVKEGPPS